MGDHQARRRLSIFGFAVVVVAVLGVLYVLSSGPVSAVAERSDCATGVVQTIYTPLTWIRQNNTFERLLTWYEELFEFLRPKTSNPDIRARQLIYTQEKLRHIPDIWERIWFLDHPDFRTPYKTKGGVI